MAGSWSQCSVQCAHMVSLHSSMSAAAMPASSHHPVPADCQGAVPHGWQVRGAGGHGRHCGQLTRTAQGLCLPAGQAAQRRRVGRVLPLQPRQGALHHLGVHLWASAGSTACSKIPLFPAAFESRGHSFQPTPALLHQLGWLDARTCAGSAGAQLSLQLRLQHIYTQVCALLPGGSCSCWHVQSKLV